MKHIKYIILLLVLVIPFKVYALGIDFSCPREVKAGTDFVCTIFGPETCSESSFDITLPSNIKFRGDIAGKNYTSVGSNTNLKYTSSGSHDRVMANINLTAPSSNGEYTITFTNIKYKYASTDANYTTKNDVNIKVKIIGANNETTTTKTDNTTTTTTQKALENLVLTLKDGEDSQTLSCTPVDGKCTIDLKNAATPIKEGYVFNGWGKDKECTEGERESYNIATSTTLYACFASTNIDSVPYLESLSIEGIDIEFSKFKLDYEINIDDNIDKLNITAIPLNDSDNLVINNPDKLVSGLNTITITVSNKLNTQVYTIKAIKGNTDNLLLSNLEVENYDIGFTPRKFVYDIVVDGYIQKLNIKAEVSDPSVKYEILDNNNLGSNSLITIRLTNQEGETKDYLINVKINSLFLTYKNYIIWGGVVLFMFIVYFIVRGIKKKNGEITPRRNKSKKKKTKKEKKKDNKVPEPEPLETL